MNRIRVPDIIFKWTNCCRLCLSQESTIDLFSESSIIQHFPSKIRTCLNFLIYSGDPMPRKICATCCMKLNHWFEFRKDCIQTEKELRRRLEPYKTIAFVKEYFDKYMKYEKSSQDGSISLDSMSEYDEEELYEELGEDRGNMDMYYCNFQKEDDNSSFSDNDKAAPLTDNSNFESKKTTRGTATKTGNGQNVRDESVIAWRNSKEMNNDSGASQINKGNLKNARQDKDQNGNDGKKKFPVAKDAKATARKCDTSTGRMEQEIFAKTGTIISDAASGMNRKVSADAQKLETPVKCSDFQIDQLSIHSPQLMESGGESDDNDNFINPLSFVYTSLSEPQKEMTEGDCTASTSNDIYKNEEDSEKKIEVTPWKCLVCNEYFATMVQLIQHYNSGNSNCGKTEIDLECGYCSIKFNSKSDFVEHQLVHINDGSAENINLVKCNECDEEFENEIFLKQHICAEDGGAAVAEYTGYVCSKCDQTFQDKELFEKHELIHNQQDIFNSIVTPQFTAFEGVEDESDPFDDDKRALNVVRCFRCGRIFNSARELERHELLKHKNPTPFFCRKCNLRFSARSQLLMHVRSHMRKSNPCTSSNSGSENTCGVCNAKFYLSSDLQSHMKMHKYSPTEELLPPPPPPPPPPVTQKPCPIPESFGDNKIDLFARFKCSVCSKIFAHSGSIIRHGKNLHKGQAVFPLRLKRPVFLMKRARSLSFPTDKGLKIPQLSKPINSDNVAGSASSSTAGAIASSVAISAAGSQQQMMEENFDPEVSQEPKYDQDADNGKSDANLEFGTEKCPFCEKMFKPTYLPRHIKRNHRGEVLDPQMLGRDIPDDSLVCRYCLKSCSNPHNRRVHESIHYPVKMQCTQCKICGEKFYNKSAYEAHVLSCKSVRCGKCNKIFFRHLSLKNHSCIVTIPTENKA